MLLAETNGTSLTRLAACKTEDPVRYSKLSIRTLAREPKTRWKMGRWEDGVESLLIESCEDFSPTYL